MSIREKTGEARAVTLAKILSIAGFTIVFLWALSAVGIGIEALLLGGALTGVVLGIAAQQTLGNIFAGLVLLVVRPFMVGQDTVLKSSLGEYHGRGQQPRSVLRHHRDGQRPGGRAERRSAGIRRRPGASSDADTEEPQPPDGPEQPPG